MPIEFRCTNCDRLLRTQDDTAGKKTKCPECGTVLTIPAATTKAASEPAWSAEDLKGAAAAQYRPTEMQDSANPYRSPQTAGSFGESVHTPSGTITPTEISVGDVYSRTWELFKQHLGPLLGMVLLIVGINYAVGFLFGITATAIALAVRPGRFELALIQFLVQILVGFFQWWIMVGAIRFMLNLVRTGQPTFGLVFSGGPWLLRFAGGTILFMLATGVGFIPLIILSTMLAFGGAAGFFMLAIILGFIPAIIVALTFWPFNYLIVDQNQSIIDSLKTAATITRGNRLALFAILLLTIPVMILGALACIVGIFPAMGFIFLLMAVAYLCMIGQPPTVGQPNAPPSLR